jgi:CBS domain containing-hemolysin-like protein
MIAVNAIWFFIGTLLLLGFFAGIEMAFYSVNRLDFEIKKKQGGHDIQMLTRFFESPAQYLGAALVGFSFFLVLLVLQLNTVMRPIWNELHLGSDGLHIIVEIILATFFVLVFAEFVPRAIFRANSSWLLQHLASIINFFYKALAPIASAFIDFAEWILKYIFNIRLDSSKESLKRSDLRFMFTQQLTDERQERNAQLMENAQELPNVKIRQCLVPRKEIIGIEKIATIEEVNNKFIETKLSKLVVFDNNIDHIVGYIHQLDLFKNPGQISDILLSIPAVPESMSATDLIGKFTKERKSIAWVVDEFGGTAGIITLEDVLEELFGDIQDEYDTEELLEKRLADGAYLFSGRIELDHLKDKYGLDFIKDDAETLSGYIINYHETIPKQKERIIIDDYEFDILQVSDTRIETVKLKKLK